jgi:hypothetical protein
MVKAKTLIEAYDSCIASGFVRDQEAEDSYKIKTLVELSKATLGGASTLKSKLDQKGTMWSVVYTLYYDAIHKLADAIVLFDRKKISNHQCLFAYLCMKNQDLELDWNFFEMIRTKRNGVNYYGSLVTYSDFKEMEFQAQLYIKTLNSAIQEKLNKQTHKS